ncbi:hypothetical protein C8R43DRAFT_679084 [Mycena crocata]|nr:hypothetical protein C8R43DRAFT_679084 [Mycena crocata]
MSEPILPPELERHIFEIAALSHLKSISNFLLVAQRVKIWIVPLLYRVVVFYRPLDGHISFEPSRFASAVQSQNVAKYVEHIYWDASIPDDFDSTLSSCSAVHNLAIRGGEHSRLSCISLMPLQHLSINLTHLFSPQPVNFRHSLFAGITHLYLIDNIQETSWEDWEDLALLPCLTHLAFLIDISIPIFQGALSNVVGCGPLSSSSVALCWNISIGTYKVRLRPLRTICGLWPCSTWHMTWTTGRSALMAKMTFGRGQTNLSDSACPGKLIPGSSSYKIHDPGFLLYYASGIWWPG